MAKSLRSKWKRKMKAIKRVRYGDKELKKLKEMVERNQIKDLIQKNITEVKDIEMKDKKSSVDKEVEPMETNKDLKPNTKTFRDQFGHYPQWMGGRQVKKLKTKLKRLKNKK